MLPQRISRLALAILLTSALGAGTARSQPDFAKASDTLIREISRSGSAPVVVELNAPATKAGGDWIGSPHRAVASRLASDLKSSGVAFRHTFRTAPFVVADANSKGLAALLAHPDVKAVALDPVVSSQMIEAAIAIDQPAVVTGLGFDGTGVTIAFVDSGVDTDHPDLVGSVVAQQRFLNRGGTTGPTAEDDNGHGTHVAGVMVGRGVVSPPGVAPGANIVAVKVLDANGQGYLSDVARGLEWIGLQVGIVPGLSIVNMSLGDGIGSPLCPCDGVPDYQLLRSIVDSLANTNLTMVAASGNMGFTDRIAAPACLSGVISVGSTYDTGFVNAPVLGVYSGVAGFSGFAACSDSMPNMHDIACYTNRNACLDLLAPGYEIRTSQLNGAAIMPYWGTSMSAPMVAGTVALMREKTGPALPAPSIEFTLLSSSFPQTDPVTGLTFGRLNALSAVIGSPGPPPGRPVFVGVPDIVVGDHEDGDASNVFVYPDAIDLNLHLSDDDTTLSALALSFSAMDGIYEINGSTALLGADDPLNPPAARRLDLVDADPGGVVGIDGDPFTLTVRNAAISPVFGIPPFTSPGGPGVLTTMTRTLTLHASDLTTFTSDQFVVYTANDTSDSISTALEFVDFYDYEDDPSLTMGWLGLITQGSGAVGTAGGLCMTAPLLGNNSGGWISPEGYAPLVDNRVYRLRATVEGTQLSPDAIIFWSVVYNNFYLSNPFVGNNYGGEDWFYDVDGGANGVSRAQGRTQFDFWAAPNAVLTDQWRGVVDFADSAFAPVADPNNDMSITFRFNDLEDAPINANLDSGGLCMRSLRVDGADITRLQSVPVYNPPLNNATHSPFEGGQQFGGVSFIDDAQATAFYQVAAQGPGSRKTLFPFDLSMDNGVNGNLQLYPVLWESDTLYMGRSLIRSNVAGGVEGTDPVNIVVLGFNTANFELGHLHVTSEGSPSNMHNAASPRLASTTGGVAQPYVTFFWSHNATLSPTLDANRLRLFVDLFNVDVVGPLGDGLDPLAIESLEIEKVFTAGF